VTESAAQQAHLLGCEELAEWCRAAANTTQPRKANQDKLDSALCLLIALHWRLRPRGASLLLGDSTSGYIVLPASPEVRRYLTEPARKYSVAMDGVVPALVTPP
jgi:predicted RNase H-like nuclease